MSLMRFLQIILDESPGFQRMFPGNQADLLADQFVIDLFIQNLLPELLPVEVRLLGCLERDL